MKINANMSFGVVNPEVTFLVQTLILCIYGEDQEKYNSEHLRPSVKHSGGSAIGLHFRQWRWGCCQN